MVGKIGEVTYNLVEGIKKIRLNKGMSQEKFAEEIGYSREQYSRVESHNRNISLDLLLVVMLKFQVSMEDLLDDADKSFVERSIDKRIAELPEDVRESALIAIGGVLAAFEWV